MQKEACSLFSEKGQSIMRLHETAWDTMRQHVTGLNYMTCTDINTLSQTVAELSLSPLKWQASKYSKDSGWVGKSVDSSQSGLTHSMLLELSLNLWKQPEIALWQENTQGYDDLSAKGNL